MNLAGALAQHIGLEIAEACAMILGAQTKWLAEGAVDGLAGSRADSSKEPTTFET